MPPRVQVPEPHLPPPGRLVLVPGRPPRLVISATQRFVVFAEEVGVPRTVSTRAWRRWREGR